MTVVDVPMAAPGSVVVVVVVSLNAGDSGRVSHAAASRIAARLRATIGVRIWTTVQAVPVNSMHWEPGRHGRHVVSTIDVPGPHTEEA